MSLKTIIQYTYFLYTISLLAYETNESSSLEFMYSFDLNELPPAQTCKNIIVGLRGSRYENFCSTEIFISKEKLSEQLAQFGYSLSDIKPQAILPLIGSIGPNKLPFTNNQIYQNKKITTIKDHPPTPGYYVYTSISMEFDVKDNLINGLRIILSSNAMTTAYQPAESRVHISFLEKYAEEKILKARFKFRVSQPQDGAK